VKKYIIFFSFFVVIYFIPVYALSWPADIINFLSFFGQAEEPNREFSQGLILKDAGTVRVANYGRHLISIETEDDFRTFPSTLGDAAIFVHDDGMQTIYSNLRDSMLFAEGTKIEMGSVIGQTGASAWCEENALIFQVIDTKNNAFINPLPLLIPSHEDEIPPQIQDAVLVTGGNRTLNLTEIKAIKKGQYDLYASIIDRTEKGGIALAPYRINVLINGINIMTVPFEILTGESGNIYLQSIKMKASSLYQNKERIYLGKINLTSGKVELTINARDITGNEKSEIFSFQVE